MSEQEQMPSKHEYVNMKGRYAGDINPATKLREGQGAYTYTNTFFQYQGEWNSGIKSGKGAIVMRDGSYYEGDFVEGEMTGDGERTWDDGSKFVGKFIEGEKHGYGEMTYGPRTSAKEYRYKGDFNFNVRQGYGELTMRDGTVIKGEFDKNHPEGHADILYSNGDTFKGNVNKGVINGLGEIQYIDGSAYKGNFVNGVKQGHGTFYISPEQGGTYSWSGEFEKGEPSIQANDMVFDLVSPVEPSEPTDPKAKAAAAKGGVKPTQFTEDEETRYERKILYQIGGEFEEPQNVSFNLRCIYQGPDVEDTSPPEEETNMKKAGKSKDQTEQTPQVRMVKPAAVTLETEKGRVFEIELGRRQKILSADHTIEEVDEMKETAQDVPEDWFMEKWIRYKFKQDPPPPKAEDETLEDGEEHKNDITEKSVEKTSKKDKTKPTSTKAQSVRSMKTHTTNCDNPEGIPDEEKLHHIQSESGVASVENFQFHISQAFKSGNYEIICREVTTGLVERQKMPKMTILLKVVDLDEEAAKLEAEKNAPKGKKR